LREVGSHEVGVVISPGCPMTEPSTHLVLESREQLFAALGEAGELEHNLLCLYLYAAFSLKRTKEEGITAPQLDAVARWRQVILGIALEEMTHLVLVSNITVALGASPNFTRPNFPASPGFYPAALVIELAPFDLSTLEHFIYLERPAAREAEVQDGATFPHREQYLREAPVGRLVPHGGDYATVGSLYGDIRRSIETLSESLGEERFFARETARQVGPLDSQLPGLTLVTDRESAVRALDTIVTQGEGALTEEGSHFARFQAIAAEYRELLKSDPTFVPGRPVARNPVMRRPPAPEGRVWIQNPLAVRYVDVADALYTFMLRVLVQVFTVEGRTPPSKRALLETTLDVMHAMTYVAEAVTYFSANGDAPAVRAGLSFAMAGSLAPLDGHAESALLAERLLQIAKGFDELQSELRRGCDAGAPPSAGSEPLERARALVDGCRERILAAPATPAALTPVPSPPPLPAAEFAGADVARGKSLTVSFDAKRCIHSRHCVTELPRVFKANAPGTWLFPDEAESELLAAVIRECPSGALQYERLDDRPAEPSPEVNLIHVQENGPYAVLADTDLGGRNVGYRVTLCRCGQSKNKPLCDGSHTAAQFTATGAPATLDATALSERGGRLRIDPTPNGPLALTGNVELCAGTGRIVLRTVAARLCRCGHSKTKPLCDGSHVAAGFVSEKPAAAVRGNAARPGE
jgi:CDGSH-type Zn-finger protein/uncharacterized Fe-S cluster protein YjdI